jgi:2-C-methyl-D-erythritol 4-phosphate cytidylyltransferase
VTALIIVAAGSGSRLAAGVPKALVQVGGRSLLQHCLDTAATVARITETVVVVPADQLAEVAASLDARSVGVVAGGATRDESVRAGLARVADSEQVLVHDAARPFVPAEVFERVIDALLDAAAVIPAVPVVDTIKRVQDGVVVDTPRRDELVAVQTPQGFRAATLRAAHMAEDPDVTDDATRVERTGIPVRVVAGSVRGFKITTPVDLAVATAMLEDR